MAGENTQQGTQGAGEGTAGTPVEKPAQVLQPAPKPQQQQAAPAKEPVAKETPAPAAGSKSVRVSDAGELPEDADLVEMTPSALKKRLARHTTAELKRRFGVEDPDEVVKKLARLKELEDAEEVRKTAEMTEVDRAKVRAEKAEARATAAEARAREVALERVYDREDANVSRIMGEFLEQDEDVHEQEARRFAKYLAEEFPGKEGQKRLDKLTPKQNEKLVRTYFEARVKAKPKIAKGYEEAQRKAIEKELKDGKPRPKVPVTNGAKDKEQPAARNDAGQPKTFAPGRANSYTDAEARAEMKKQGIHY